MPKTTVNEIEIEYDSFGNSEAEAVLLISGLGTQMTRWSETFCRLLAEQGLRVIRFDNRDVGLSTHFDSASMPDLAAISDAASVGVAPNVPYTLFDMANDALGLLDSLQIQRAHVVGRSMGGMIAQLLASEHPERVLSLVSMMSSTGNRELPQASPAVMALMTSPAPHPLKDEKGYLAHCVAFSKMIAGRGYPFDESAQREQALAEVQRAYNPGGFWRHIAAIAATGDLRSRLAKVSAPALVIHGSDDPLVSSEAGKDTAANIRGAKLLIIDGMGHDFPPALFGFVAGAIADNARRTVKPV
ncbi:alpha/beta hydrolase [Achromobacter seleniivolatilans]|uniref:Alpha/beta hydrolase n=1 Tax=Achromobacter seleniivolatilans TaxID=3047478 RepID=A0ABY9M7C5_9BURK|nr:alpha/beta hydrolase [Achromobacter sp. R39]WMD21707.1 alpha/beta hydrolase [Achromobacter sp. R39]